ncbi:helix-turn-helix domain-containing protein [Paenibacillus sp. GCM10023252]|uniref:helix-turn-helix domain-containing protein n=1 Tax=Paenibacillus sp. GCM10023252 TaxID=3252649 RepID=UPI0036152334
MSTTLYNDSKQALSRSTPVPIIHTLGDLVKRAGALGPRRLIDYELLYFPNGTGTLYEVEGEEYCLDKPGFIITRPQELHSYRYNPELPSRHLFVHFRLDEEPSEELKLPILKVGGPAYIPLDQELLVGMLKQIMRIAYTSPSQLQQRGGPLLLALLEEINAEAAGHSESEPVRAPSPPIAKALDYMEKHLADPLTAGQLAQVAGWTHEHFTRSFARQMGRGPRDMIIHRRIERACQLLLYEDWNVKRIASEVGFADENYFYRMFRTLKGMTPTQYRHKYYHPSYREVFPDSGEDTLYPPNRILYNIWECYEE